MGKLIEYIKDKWNRRFAIKPSEKYPPIDENQRKYREEFEGIVDKYLINVHSDRDANHPNAYHRIVFIDAVNDIDWIVAGEGELSKEELQQRQVSLAKLDIAQALPVQNLSEKEVIAFKTILGRGYDLALTGNHNEVLEAIDEAKKYRNDRNKERSRGLLLTYAFINLCLFIVGYLLFVFFIQEHPHFEIVSGSVMGGVGAFVSIWARSGDLDLTGLGDKGLHYLEAMSRIIIGAIFAFVLMCALKSGLVFSELLSSEHALALSMVLGFFAGFSEKFVPSILESIMNKTEN